MKKRIAVSVILIMLLCVSACACAEEAKEITSGVSYAADARSTNFDDMHDNDFGTYFPLKDEDGWLEVHSEQPVGGIYIIQFERNAGPMTYDLQSKDEAGEWTTVAQGGEYLVQWHPLNEPVKDFRICGTGKERIRIAELRLYGEGIKPKEVQSWQTAGKCDMMLLTGHPDDEILWFAGLLPTYAGDRGLQVQVAVMVPTNGERKLEMLHAMWHCGVDVYPEFIGLVDKYSKTVEGQYKAWKGKDRVLGLVTAVIRKHQPEVLITHSERGEYGHGAHKVACDAAKACVKLAGNKNKFRKSAEQYGVWQIKKLYLHEYRKNVIPCDWSAPLKAFGGKNGYEVAAEAYCFHRSQTKLGWKLENDGTVRNNKGIQDYDNALFGLYYTAVGEDTGTGDFMEHIKDE